MLLLLLPVLAMTQGGQRQVMLMMRITLSEVLLTPPPQTGGDREIVRTIGPVRWREVSTAASIGVVTRDLTVVGGREPPRPWRVGVAWRRGRGE